MVAQYSEFYDSVSSSGHRIIIDGCHGREAILSPALACNLLGE